MIHKKRFLFQQFIAMGATEAQAKAEVKRLVKEGMLNKAFDFYTGRV